MSTVVLFAGIGGFSQGAAWASCPVGLAVDCNQEILDIHQLNHPQCQHLCLTLPSTDIPFPPPDQRWHLHSSLPHQLVEGRAADGAAQQRGLALVSWVLELVKSKRPASWTLDAVPSPRLQSLLRAHRHHHPNTCAWVVFPKRSQAEPRLLAGSPRLIESFKFEAALGTDRQGRRQSTTWRTPPLLPNTYILPSGSARLTRWMANVCPPRYAAAIMRHAVRTSREAEAKHLLSPNPPLLPEWEEKPAQAERDIEGEQEEQAWWLAIFDDAPEWQQEARHTTALEATLGTDEIDLHDLDLPDLDEGKLQPPWYTAWSRSVPDYPAVDKRGHSPVTEIAQRLMASALPRHSTAQPVIRAARALIYIRAPEGLRLCLMPPREGTTAGLPGGETELGDGSTYVTYSSILRQGLAETVELPRALEIRITRVLLDEPQPTAWHRGQIGSTKYHTAVWGFEATPAEAEAIQTRSTQGGSSQALELSDLAPALDRLPYASAVRRALQQQGHTPPADSEGQRQPRLVAMAAALPPLEADALPTLLPPPLPSEPELRQAQADDEECVAITKRRAQEVEVEAKQSAFSVENGVLRKAVGSLRVPVIPMSMRSLWLRAYHDQAGHFGQDATEGRLAREGWWPSVRDDVRNWINTCKRCLQSKQPKRKGGSLLQLPIGTRCFEHVVADVLGPLPVTTSGNTHIILFVDKLSRFAEAFPVTRSPTTEDIVKHLIADIVSRYGNVTTMYTDLGSPLISAAAKQAYELLGILHLTSTAEHHSTVGTAERLNSIIERMLRAYGNTTMQWDSLLCHVMGHYRAAPQRALGGASPHGVLFGVEAVNPLVSPLLASPVDENEQREYKQTRQLRVVELLTELRNKRHEKDKRRRDARTDTELAFEEGDQVAALRIDAKNKLEPLCYGPLVVVEVLPNDNYRLAPVPPNTHDRFHVSRLQKWPHREQEDDAKEGGGMATSATTPPVHTPGKGQQAADELAKRAAQTAIYQLEEIVAHHGSGSTLTYSVKWLGWPRASISREPGHIIWADCAEHVQQYWDDRGEANPHLKKKTGASGRKKGARK